MLLVPEPTLKCHARFNYHTSQCSVGDRFQMYLWYVRNEGQLFSKRYFSLGLLDSLRIKWRPWIWGESRQRHSPIPQRMCDTQLMLASVTRLDGVWWV